MTDPETLEELKGRNEEVVTLQEGKQMAKEIGAYSYKECSAKTSYGVQEVFEDAIKASFLKQTKIKGKCCVLF